VPVEIVRCPVIPPGAEVRAEDGRLNHPAGRVCARSANGGSTQVKTTRQRQCNYLARPFRANGHTPILAKASDAVRRYATPTGPKVPRGLHETVERTHDLQRNAATRQGHRASDGDVRDHAHHPPQQGSGQGQPDPLLHGRLQREVT